MIRRAALIVGATLALSPPPASAQQSCTASAPRQVWPAPLDRRIALRARDVSLREALDRVAAAARFRVSYSAEFLPLDRHVCVSADSILAGDALAELLTGVNVSPVVTASDQVVIAPSRQAAVAPSGCTTRRGAPVPACQRPGKRSRRSGPRPSTMFSPDASETIRDGHSAESE